MKSLFIAIVLVGALFAPAKSRAQDSAPRPDTPHPETGEPGVWIPLWLEHQHVLDDAELEICRRDLEATQLELESARKAFQTMRAAYDELDVLLGDAEVRELALRERLLAKDRKLERRARLAWTLGGATTVALAAFALILWVP